MLKRKRFFFSIPVILLALSINSISVTNSNDSTLINTFSNTQGLVELTDLSNQIAVDLHYTRPGNRFGDDIYGDLEQCFLTEETAKALVKAQEILSKVKPGYSLLVYDCARSSSLARKMSPITKTFGEKEMNSHLHGIAVDLTIADHHLRPLDMGTGYDSEPELSARTNEKQLVKEFKLSREQVKNRNRLKMLMKKAGFESTNKNWWHFHLPHSKDNLSKKFAKIK